MGGVVEAPLPCPRFHFLEPYFIIKLVRCRESADSAAMGLVSHDDVSVRGAHLLHVLRPPLATAAILGRKRHERLQRYIRTNLIKQISQQQCPAELLSPFRPSERSALSSCWAYPSHPLQTRRLQHQHHRKQRHLEGQHFLRNRQLHGQPIQGYWHLHTPFFHLRL